MSSQTILHVDNFIVRAWIKDNKLFTIIPDKHLTGHIIDDFNCFSLTTRPATISFFRKSNFQDLPYILGVKYRDITFIYILDHDAELGYSTCTHLNLIDSYFNDKQELLGYHLYFSSELNSEPKLISYIITDCDYNRIDEIEISEMYAYCDQAICWKDNDTISVVSISGGVFGDDIVKISSNDIELFDYIDINLINTSSNEQRLLITGKEYSSSKFYIFYYKLSGRAGNSVENTEIDYKGYTILDNQLYINNVVELDKYYPTINIGDEPLLQLYHVNDNRIELSKLD